MESQGKTGTGLDPRDAIKLFSKQNPFGIPFPASKPVSQLTRTARLQTHPARSEYFDNTPETTIVYKFMFVILSLVVATQQRKLSCTKYTGSGSTHPSHSHFLGQEKRKLLGTTGESLI